MTSNYLERIWDPWREFDRMARLFGSSTSSDVTDFPAVNVWVNGENAVITTEIPGVDRNDIDISVAGNTVTLRGKRQVDECGEGKSCHRHELWHGNFNKTITLPFAIDANKVHATYKRGILNVSLPQLESEKPKKIAVKSE